MNKYNEQGEKHGPWESYYENGKLSSKENYVNGKQNGLWEHINENGRLLNLYYRII